MLIHYEAHVTLIPADRTPRKARLPRPCTQPVCALNGHNGCLPRVIVIGKRVVVASDDKYADQAVEPVNLHNMHYAKLSAMAIMRAVLGRLPAWSRNAPAVLAAG